MIRNICENSAGQIDFLFLACMEEISTVVKEIAELRLEMAEQSDEHKLSHATAHYGIRPQ